MRFRGEQYSRAGIGTASAKRKVAFPVLPRSSADFDHAWLVGIGVSTTRPDRPASPVLSAGQGRLGRSRTRRRSPMA